MAFEKIRKLLGDTPENDEVEASDDYEDEPQESMSDDSLKAKPKFILRKPEERSELAEIANDLMSQKIVILNLELINKSEIRRFIDFLQGTIFALRGQMKKLSDATYLFIPGQVDIKGDILDDVEKLL